jgi:DNA invertase Pin-like site-specific DNA recombinase
LWGTSAAFILIERLDRLARSLSVQESIIAELKRHGFELISVEEPGLLKDEVEVVVTQYMLSVMAQIPPLLGWGLRLSE